MQEWDRRRQTPANKWHDWHRQYDEPGSPLSRRLDVVRGYLAAALAAAPDPVRLISLCAGDGRDCIPVIAAADRDVDALLVEIDAQMSGQARVSADGLGLAMTVRTADAGLASTFADQAPADVFMLCGVFGNISIADIRRTVAALPAFLSPDATVIWTRGNHRIDGEEGLDPSEEVRMIFEEAGFLEVDFTRPVDAGFRVGMHRWPGHAGSRIPDHQRLFTFLW